MSKQKHAAAESVCNPRESQVIKIWQNQSFDRAGLTSEEGKSLKIIYPGRINDDRGADFRDAVIATSHSLIKGDIEIHVKSSDWRVHGHYKDPTYNKVILHVVMRQDTKAPTTLQNGRTVPTLVLNKHIENPVNHSPELLYPPTRPGTPCFMASKYMPPAIITRFLNINGDKRFLTKAGRFQAGLIQMEAKECLYQGIMVALGYSKNKLPFLELAQRLPLQTLESITHKNITDRECLARQQSLLLGTAGLLPSQCHFTATGLDSQWIEKLEQLWADSRQVAALPQDAWHLFKVRPNNSPIRRIAAMSYLILRYRGKGIFEELVNMVKEAPLIRGHLILERVLTVSDSSRQIQHALGNRRAADIIVNVLLPFAFAWSKISSQPEIGRKSFALYCHYPKLTPNSVEKHMINQLGINRRFIKSARQQQGLVHIYNTLCTQGRCNSCLLNRLKPA